MSRSPAGSVIRECFEVLEVAFDPHMPWRLAAHGERFAAVLDDPVFWLQIEAGRPFATGDRLDCEFQPGDDATPARIVRVLAHHHRPEMPRA